MQPSNSAYDSGIAWRLAALVILSLLVVFIMQRIGFRFVTAGNVSVGVGG